MGQTLKPAQHSGNATMRVLFSIDTLKMDVSALENRNRITTGNDMTWLSLFGIFVASLSNTRTLPGTGLSKITKSQVEITTTGRI